MSNQYSWPIALGCCHCRWRFVSCLVSRRVRRRETAVSGCLTRGEMRRETRRTAPEKRRRRDIFIETTAINGRQPQRGGIVMANTPCTALAGHVRESCRPAGAQDPVVGVFSIDMSRLRRLGGPAVNVQPIFLANRFGMLSSPLAVRLMSRLTTRET